MLVPLSDDLPQLSFPWATVMLIAFCGAVYFWTSADHARLTDVIHGFGCIPAVLFGHADFPAGLRHAPAWLTPLTSAFIHTGIIHLAGNMLFLWIFGRHLEDALGWYMFLPFVIVGAVAASLAQAHFNAQSSIPCVGASGFISALMGGYVVMFPRSKLTFFSTEWLEGNDYAAQRPAWQFMAAWFFVQLVLFSQFGIDNDYAKTGFAAHIGGFACGVVVAWLMAKSGLAVTYVSDTIDV